MCGLLVALTVLSAKVQLSAVRFSGQEYFFRPPPLFFPCYSCWWRSSSRRPPPQQQRPHCNITLPRTRLNTVLLGKSPRQIPGNLGGGGAGGRPTSCHRQSVWVTQLWHGAVGQADRAVQLRRAWA